MKRTKCLGKYVNGSGNKSVFYEGLNEEGTIVIYRLKGRKCEVWEEKDFAREWERSYKRGSYVDVDGKTKLASPGFGWCLRCGLQIRICNCK